jgi:molybdate transport system regulatory protein
MKVRSKVWFEKNGKLVFGAGRARILKAVIKTGSLNAAAKDLGMSYRHLWSSIKTAEERLGKPLLIKTRGGKSGGGAILTPFAKKLLKQFDTLNNSTRKHVDKQFNAHN